MLQRVQPQIREIGGLGIAEDAEDATFVFEFVEHLLCSLAPRRFGDNRGLLTVAATRARASNLTGKRRLSQTPAVFGRSMYGSLYFTPSHEEVPSIDPLHTPSASATGQSIAGAPATDIRMHFRRCGR